MINKYLARKVDHAQSLFASGIVDRIEHVSESENYLQRVLGAALVSQLTWHVRHVF